MECWTESRTEAAAILDSGLELGDLNFVAAKGNGFACGGRGCNDLPRPILIFVATKKNGNRSQNGLRY